MGQALKAILEKDGRLRLISNDEEESATIEVGESLTVVVVGIADDTSQSTGYALLSEEALSEFWEEEPDIEDVWEIT